MKRSLVLRGNPTVRETNAILARLETALGERGATTHRRTPGEVSFRMPPPWRFARLGLLGLITRGTAVLSAWGGGPWRVSYRLYFGALQVITGVLTLVIAVLGWSWPRSILLSILLGLWLFGYGSLHLLASHRFRDFLRGVMHDVTERRSRPRAERRSASATSQQPE
ncbi:MAG TPA: hypothetical protein VFU01_14265 [Gemmatimonadaceae bacterium]|nr:hypothetical protein [Gemmatimonadaceae bacterium]